MRTRIMIAGAVILTCGVIVACVDLFHSTSDVQSLCDIDSAAPGCDSGTDAAPPVTLCAADAGVAQNEAKHACAWLAACEHPIGKNLTGVCIVDAILAYDCTANPNRKPKGAAKAFWECMQNASTCAAVADCAFPSGPTQCLAGGFLGCSQSDSNPDTRIDCPVPTGVGGAAGENCAAHGQTCDALDPDASNRNALCVGALRRACTGNGCVSYGDAGATYLSLCDDAGIDHGYNCASVGAGACDLAGPACVPEDAGSGAPHTNVVTCSSGNVLAQGSPAAFKETIDCTAISGPGTCVPIEAGAPGTVPSDACLTTGCTTDTCNGAKLTACVRGRAVDIDCAALGLKTCDSNVQSEEQGPLAACSPP